MGKVRGGTFGNESPTNKKGAGGWYSLYRHHATRVGWEPTDPETLVRKGTLGKGPPPPLPPVILSLAPPLWFSD